MRERYRIEFTEGGVGFFENAVTFGAASVIEKGMDALMDGGHGWDCRITDTETGLHATRWGVTKGEAQEEAFRALAEETREFEEQQEEERREANRRRRERDASSERQISSSGDSEGTEVIGKLIGYLIAIVAVLWFVFSVAIPLLMINVAAIALIVSRVRKEQRYIFLSLSFLGAILVAADYNIGWSTKTLVSNVSFFAGIVPVLVYVNLIAGFVAAYFLTEALLNSHWPIAPDRTNELSRRRTITTGSVLLVGGLVIGAQMHFGPGGFDRSASPTSTATNDQRIAVPSQLAPEPPVPQAGAIDVPGDSTQVMSSTDLPQSMGPGGLENAATVVAPSPVVATRALDSPTPRISSYSDLGASATLQFAEMALGATPDESTPSARVFVAASARRVFAIVTLTYPPARNAILQVPVQCTFVNSRGAATTLPVIHFHVDSAGQRSFGFASDGSLESGYWQPGPHSATCESQSSPVVSGEFEMTGPAATITMPVDSSTQPSRMSPPEGPEAALLKASGTYVSRAGDYVELRRDGSFVLSFRGQSMRGSFTIQGQEISMKVPTDVRPAKARLTSGGLLFPSGETWTKR